MDINNILGTWKLFSFEYRANDGTHFSPYGKDPQGILIYDKSGYMSGIMSKNNRLNSSLELIQSIPANEKNLLSYGFVSYSGKFEMLEDKIVHHVEVSFFPNWIGEPLDRYYKFDDKKLILSTPAVNFEGKDFIGYIVWERGK